MKLPFSLASLVLTAAFGTSIASAGFINGGLVPGVPISDPGYDWIAGDSVSLTGWTVNDVDLVSYYWQGPPGSAFSVDLNGNGPGYIYQLFTTAPGQQYMVNFYYAGNPDPLNGAGRTASVMASGNPSQPITTVAGPSRTAMNWQLGTYIFTASSATTRLTFTGQTTNDTGVVLGNVKVTAIGSPTPEPASFGVAAAALAWLVIRKRRAARQS